MKNYKPQPSSAQLQAPRASEVDSASFKKMERKVTDLESNIGVNKRKIDGMEK